MKKTIIALTILFTFQMLAQTGIGTTTPDASAKLDVYATNKGFLPPRVTLTSTTDATTIASPAEGLLVYNVGSVGLQAGYYYWNGVNWATIATATSAGNGVTSSDLVKLYSKGYSTAAGDIANASGYSFTVPVSGRYLFDFSSTGFGNATITYKVRQGTTDIDTDAQTSFNNSVHVEYNGKVEVNLQSGTTYNVIVATTGNRDSGDYDRVYYKMVAGNLPVTGQSVDYAMASLSAAQTISAVGNVQFNTLQGTGITLNNGGFNLVANKTYKLEGSVGGSSTGYIYYAWVDASNNIINGGSVGGVMKTGGAYSDGPQDKAVAYYTPSSNTTVYLRVLTISGTSTAQPSTIGTPNWTSTWASISQVGSSAFVNPWILSGNNVYNNTGKVGIGTNAPTATLDVTGNVNVTGKINLTDPTGNVAVKAAGYVNAGSFVTLDNIKATVTTSGNRGLSVAAVSTPFYCNIGATFGNSAGSGGSAVYNSYVTTTPSGSWFGWNFTNAGDYVTYLVNDTTNNRVYRISMSIGAGYVNNFISIERLL
ncbi:MAG: hypothetical protein ACOYBS_09445 [Flavobacterium sp.]